MENSLQNLKVRVENCLLLGVISTQIGENFGTLQRTWACMHIRVCHQSQCEVPIGNYLALSMWKQYGTIHSSLILTPILVSVREVWHILNTSDTSATITARW